MPKKRKKLYVLIACEESQAECQAFRNLGHVAYSCDIQKCKKKANPSWHINRDVRPFLRGQKSFRTQDGKRHRVPHWDLIIAHPPCTYICKVGSIHLYGTNDGYPYCDLDRYRKMRQAVHFFNLCLNADAPYVAVENPIPMKLANLPQPSCFIEPFWFGVKYSKKTLYWLKNLPPILPTLTNPEHTCFVRASRGKYRSRTFPEVAAALAGQWSTFVLNDINKTRK